MGYTHYLYRTEELNKDTFNNFAFDCAKLLKLAIKNGIELGNWAGKFMPEATTELVSFNGVGKNSHETCCINRIYKKPDWQDINNDMVFSCTKTARKPYDIVVVAVYKLAKLHFDDDVKFTSDGGINELEPGKELAVYIYRADSLFDADAVDDIVSEYFINN